MRVNINDLETLTLYGETVVWPSSSTGTRKKPEPIETNTGFSFEDARAAFEDPYALDGRDDREDYGEERFNLTGMANSRLLVVTYTQRIDENTGDEIIRIISARKAEPREARRYHEA